MPRASRSAAAKYPALDEQGPLESGPFFVSELAWKCRPVYPLTVMVRLYASLLGVLSWGLVAFFSVRYPAPDSLGPGTLSPDWVWGWLLILAGVIAWFLWLLPDGGGKRVSWKASYRRRMLLSLLVQLSLAILCSYILHRDFLTLLFQIAAIHYGLFVDAAPRYRSRLFLAFGERLFVISLFIVGFFLFWIALMGYAIASRTEPRWIPSIGYNVLNLGIAAYICVATFNLKDRSRRELIVDGSSLLLDNLDVLPLFSPAARPLALFLAALPEGESLVCSEAQALFGDKGCERDCGKATTCAEYRYLYNRIHEVKKVFSALKIGRLVSPDNKQQILERGWSFIPDPTIHIVRGGAAPAGKRRRPRVFPKAHPFGRIRRDNDK